MTSRKSSGSRRAESSVEPTRSQNMTVSCRRSTSAGAGASRGNGGRWGAERSNCGEELAAMADRTHADADQVVGRQLRQRLAIDIVVAEGGRVLFELQPAQPRHYVDAAILGSEERKPLMKEDIRLPFGLPAAALK
jgi:hypothetical protein